MVNPYREDIEALKERRQIAQRVLNQLERRAAGFTSLNMPAELRIEIDDKEDEIARIDKQIEELEIKVLSSPQPSPDTPTNLQTLIQDAPLKQHNENLVNDLGGDWLQRFINLQMVPVKLRAEAEGAESERYDIFGVAENFADRPIAILGEPGAGKTTLVKKLCISNAANGRRVPIFVSMARYAGSDDLIGTIKDFFYGDLPLNLLESGLCLIVFDGLNEVPLNLRETAARSISRFINKYRNNQYFITCRTAEYPTFLRAEVSRFEVERISFQEARQYFINAVGSPDAPHTYDSLPRNVRDLCLNPLLLRMLTYLYLEGRKPSQTPASKAVLYKQFLSEIYKREEELRFIKLTQSVREEFLSYLAAKMDNNNISIKRETAERWIGELYAERYQNIGVSILDTFREVLELPPMKCSMPGHCTDVDVSFMHQSFQEYHTARSLLFRLSSGESPESFSDYFLPENEHWWETLSLLVGLMNDATPILKAVKKQADIIATERSNQKVYTLGARCIREAQFVAPDEVDDTIFRTLLAFKFGKVAFDYDLILGLKLISPQQRSTKFPKRLIEDMNWWLTKYANVSPAKLDKSISLETLLRFTESDDEALVIDTLFTLREYTKDDRVVKHLIAMLQTVTGLVREQLIFTLGYFEESAIEAVDSLLNIIRNDKETDRARALSLTALGKIGDGRAALAMIEYLLDHHSPYRDSAGWALQGLAKKNLNNNELIKALKKAYITALFAETNDEEGRYAKGMQLYSLGELGSIEYVENIIDYLEKQTDPYVLEDGLYCLGKLGDPRAIDLITKHITHSDPIVRMTAIDALTSLISNTPQHTHLQSNILAMLDDETSIVREHAERAITGLNQSRG